MAIDNILKVYDEQGNQVDYDILASDVKFTPDGKDLPTKLGEMEQEIEDAAGGGYAPPAGGIPKSDLASGVQSSLDKADTALQQSDKTELQNEIDNKVNAVTGKGLSTNDFTDALLAKLNNLDPYTKAQVDALIAAASSGAVSVTTNEDGTFTIHVGSTDYTINLNHTHENMAKLVVCEESDLPSTLDNSTIYAITDSGETEIEKLIIRGMEFTGGGVPDTGEPMISSPSNGSTINLGDNAAGQGVSKTITIKGKNLTGDLTVAVGTGLTISYGQSTGQSSVTIPMAQALLGAQVTIAYSGSGSLDDGSLVISHGGSVLSSVVVVVVVVLEPLAGIKFTGSQWINTDYYPNPNTEFELELRLESNNLTEDSLAAAFLRAQRNGDTTDFYVGTGLKNQRLITVHPNLSSEGMVHVDFDLSDHAKLTFEKGTSNSIVTFTGTSSDSVTGSLRNGTATTPLAICYHQKNQKVFSMFDLTIYEFTIKENGSAVRHYVPATLNGVAGLHETRYGTFLTSETSTPVVAIPISD